MDAPPGDLLGWISLVLSVFAIVVSLSSTLYQRRQTVLQEKTSQAGAIGLFAEGEEVLEEVRRLQNEHRKLESNLEAFGTDSGDPAAGVEELSDERLRELQRNREREKEKERRELHDKLAEIGEQEKRLLRKACSKFWQAIHTDSEKPWIVGRCLVLGDIYYHELADLENALTAYQIGLQCNGKDWRLHYAVGKALEERGASRKALRHFRKAAKLAPTSEREKVQDAASRVKRTMQEGFSSTRFWRYWRT